MCMVVVAGRRWWWVAEVVGDLRLLGGDGNGGNRVDQDDADRNNKSNV